MADLNDPIGDLVTRMRNAQHARRQTCRAPHSKIKQQLLEVLKREGMIENVQVIGDAPKLEVEVTFVPGKTLTLERVSKPGRRVYAGKVDIKQVLQGYGIAVITTSEGLLTDKEARKRKIGGEILCTVS